MFYFWEDAVYVKMPKVKSLVFEHFPFWVIFCKCLFGNFNIRRCRFSWKCWKVSIDNKCFAFVAKATFKYRHITAFFMYFHIAFNAAKTLLPHLSHNFELGPWLTWILPNSIMANLIKVLKMFVFNFENVLSWCWM